MVLEAEYKFQCTVCGRPFKRTDSLKNHIVTHSRRNLNCRICNKPFKSETFLLMHKQAHENVKPLHNHKYEQCPHEGCTKQFSS